MKSSSVFMHMERRWIDMTARTQRKNRSTCRRDSPFFLYRILRIDQANTDPNLGTREDQAALCLTNTIATSGSHRLSRTVLASSHWENTRSSSSCHDNSPDHTPIKRHST